MLILGTHLVVDMERPDIVTRQTCTEPGGKEVRSEIWGSGVLEAVVGRATTPLVGYRRVVRRSRLLVGVLLLLPDVLLQLPGALLLHFEVHGFL